MGVGGREPRFLLLLLTMSKLPSPTKLPVRMQNNSHIMSAYTLCLKLEESVQARMDANEDVRRSMIYCRILGYLLIHYPNDVAWKKVQSDIVSATTDQAMLEVGQFYFDHFIRACTFVHVSTVQRPHLFQFGPTKDHYPLLRGIHLVPLSIDLRI